tara:strand:- start:135 stop:314 length:180 start_codon:yes stop_codon:yes gene_type:complete
MIFEIGELFFHTNSNSEDNDKFGIVLSKNKDRMDNLYIVYEVLIQNNVTHTIDYYMRKL